jgi:hypothetical protein
LNCSTIKFLTLLFASRSINWQSHRHERTFHAHILYPPSHHRRRKIKNQKFP